MNRRVANCPIRLQNDEDEEAVSNYSGSQLGGGTGSDDAGRRLMEKEEEIPSSTQRNLNSFLSLCQSNWLVALHTRELSEQLIADGNLVFDCFMPTNRKTFRPSFPFNGSTTI